MGNRKKIESLSYECVSLKEFGKRLALHRKENNLTQELVAEKLEVSRQSIYKWESGIAYPEIEKIVQISKLYDCYIDELFFIRGNIKDDSKMRGAKTYVSKIDKLQKEKGVSFVNYFTNIINFIGLAMYKVMDIVFFSAFSFLIIKFIVVLICFAIRKQYKLVFNEIVSFVFVFILVYIYISWFGKDNTIFGKWVTIFQGVTGYVIVVFAQNYFAQKKSNKLLLINLVSLFILVSVTPFFIEHTSFSVDRDLDNIAAKIIPTIAMVYMCVLSIVILVKNRKITIVLIGVAISLLLRIFVEEFEFWWLGNVSNIHFLDLDFIKCILLIMLLIVTVLCNFITKMEKIKNPANTILTCCLFVMLLLPMLNDYLKCIGNRNMFGDYTALFQINLNLVTIILFIILINLNKESQKNSLTEKLIIKN